MAISKRLRYEILRRDNHTCRYCGASAPNVSLTVDHVVPGTLGGSDDPSNLVAACADCNAGKSSSNPDAPLVADVAQDAIRWARAREVAANALLADLDARVAYRAVFHDAWNTWTYGPEGDKQHVPLPADWESSLDNFYRYGLPELLMLDSIRAAMTANNIPVERVFRYFAGICWRSLDQLHAAARDAAETDN